MLALQEALVYERVRALRAEAEVAHTLAVHRWDRRARRAERTADRFARRARRASTALAIR